MIYIIRHGQTEGNKARLLQGRGTDTPLNETGIWQAEQARELLKTRGIHIDRLYSSPLVRAVKTGEIVSGGLKPVIDERLLEIDCGPYEGMSLENMSGDVAAFFSDFNNVPAPPGMEPLPSIEKRVGEFLETVKEEGAASNILISTHAIAMKGALEYLSPGSKGSWWMKYIANCAIFETQVVNREYTEPKELG